MSEWFVEVVHFRSPKEMRCFSPSPASESESESYGLVAKLPGALGLNNGGALTPGRIAVVLLESSEADGNSSGFSTLGDGMGKCNLSARRPQNGLVGVNVPVLDDSVGNVAA